MTSILNKARKSMTSENLADGMTEKDVLVGRLAAAADSDMDSEHSNKDRPSTSSTTDRQTSLEDLNRENEFLAQENRMLENYLTRVYPNIKLDLSADSDSKARQRGRRPGVKDGPADAFLPLTAEEKSNICSHELDAVLAELAAIEEAGKKDIHDNQVLAEEAETRDMEVKKATHEFRKEIILGAENPRTGKTISEKFVKFMEDRIKAKDQSIEKLKLKKQAIRTQCAKLRQRAEQKEEQSDMLHVVDFEQLKIENQQYVDRVDEKNSELLQAKLTTGKTVHALNAIKLQLTGLVAEHERLQKEKGDRLQQKASFGTEQSRANAELDAARKLVRRLKLEQKDTDQPHIMDYITLKHEVQELEGRKNDLVRKCDLAEMDAARTTRILKSFNPASSGTIGH